MHAGEYHSGYVRIRLQFNDIDRNYWDHSTRIISDQLEEAGELGMTTVIGSGSGNSSGSGYAYGAIVASEKAHMLA